jgi:hypothetical protein
MVVTYDADYWKILMSCMTEKIKAYDVTDNNSQSCLRVTEVLHKQDWKIILPFGMQTISELFFVILHTFVTFTLIYGARTHTIIIIKKLVTLTTMLYRFRNNFLCMLQPILPPPKAKYKL